MRKNFSPIAEAQAREREQHEQGISKNKMTQKPRDFPKQPQKSEMNCEHNTSTSYLQWEPVDKLVDFPAPSDPNQLVSFDVVLGENFADILSPFSEMRQEKITFLSLYFLVAKKATTEVKL